MQVDIGTDDSFSNGSNSKIKHTKKVGIELTTIIELY